MSLVLKDRVLETAAAPGTGAVTLLGAVTGYQTFSAAIGNGNTCYYTIADQSGANWEVGLGTYASSGNTLTRTTILSSSNAGSTVNFASGTQNVFVTYPSEKAVYLDASGNVQPSLGTATFSSITDSGLTSGRVTYAGTSGLLQDSANLTFNGTTLTANTLNLTNALGVASGGTGLNSLSSGYIPYGNGTSAFSSSSSLFFDGTNLGIGTNSPGTYGNLAVVSSSGTLISVKGGSSANQGGNFVVVKAGSNGSLALFGDSANQLGGTPDAAVGIYTASSVPLLFNVAGSEKARIDSSGNLLVGTTGTSGSSSNTALTASGLFRSYTASVNAATATATTITTLTTGINACYLVNINVNGVTNDATDYSAYATIITNGTTARIANSSNGTLCLITLSGLNVQVTQSSGSTQTCYATLTRVA